MFSLGCCFGIGGRVGWGVRETFGTHLYIPFGCCSPWSTPSFTTLGIATREVEASNEDDSPLGIGDGLRYFKFSMVDNLGDIKGVSKSRILF